MNVEKNNKLFTKEKKNNIISDKYNPLNYEREGLFMKGTKDVVLDEIMEKLNFIERIIVRIFSRTFIKVYKIGITFGFNNK